MEFKLTEKMRWEIVGRMLAGESGYRLGTLYGVSRYYPYKLFRQRQGKGIQQISPHQIHARRSLKVNKALPLPKFRMKDIQAIPVTIETFDEPEWADFCMIVLQ